MATLLATSSWIHARIVALMHLRRVTNQELPWSRMFTEIWLQNLKNWKNYSVMCWLYMALMFLGRLKCRIKPLIPYIKIWLIEGTQKGTVRTTAWSQTTGFVYHYIPPFKKYAVFMQRLMIVSVCMWIKLWMHKIKFHNQ